MTEANEFAEIYKLEVIDIPTNVPVIRIDHDDEVYRTTAEKNEAIVEQIADCAARGQPLLVGTVSIDKSERLPEFLTKRGLPHHVLNARYPEQAAVLVSQAGRPGAAPRITHRAQPRHH